MSTRNAVIKLKEELQFWQEVHRYEVVDDIELKLSDQISQLENRDEFGIPRYNGHIDDEDNESCFDSNHRNVTCRYCGKSGFYWMKTVKGWRLSSSDGIHSCLQTHKNADVLNLSKDNQQHYKRGSSMKILTGRQTTARRTMLYGVHGVGKSTWAAQAPSPLILNLEDGVSDIDCAKTEVLHTLEDFMNVLRWLGSEKHDFKTLVIDTLDWLESLIHAEIAKRANKASIADIGYGAGYKSALAEWDKIIGPLDWLRKEKGLNIIALAHAQIKRFDSPETESYDRYQPALHESASAMWQEWCDEVLFASYKVFTRKEDQGFNKERSIATGDGLRYVRTQESAAVLAKNRLGMPPEIEFSWKAYACYFPKPGNIDGIVKDGSSKK